MALENLTKLQRRFNRCLNQSRYTATDIKPLGIRATKEFKATDRFGIYHYAYFERIYDSLCEDFPRLHEKMGDSKFRKTIRQFLQKHPSQYPGLAEVGRRLPLFLKSAELRNLAKLEWLKLESEWVPDPEPFDWSLLAQYDSLEGIVFELHPAVRLFKNSKEYFLIYRTGWDSEIKSISKLEFEVLECIKKGKSLPKLPEEKLYAFFFEWVSQQVLSHFRHRQ